ncbi:MAG TPA: serine hydrolase, partial [Bryobacteraceae bacterium]|nr:serine hydrolase [Bryobacteraceae bacterium]
GIGLANRELNVANNPETKFRLGSITKQFTATAIVLLEQRGKLKLQDTLDKHIPDAPGAWGTIQIHHLLSHTAGVPSYTSDASYRREMFKPFPMPELIGRFRSKPLEFEPGAEWKYSNSGYVLLGDIIQRVSGMSYEEFLEKNIFKPIGMNNSGYDHFETVFPNRASGYTRAGGRWENAAYLDMTQPHAAGALYSTVDDLYLWDQALATDRILSSTALERMYTPVKNSYGYGWVIAEEFGTKVIGHGGGINGFATFIARTPADKTLVVVLSNVESTNAGKIARDLRGILYDKPVAVPKLRQRISMSGEKFDPFQGRYELAPGFQIRVWREGNRFLTQATGQGQAEIFPESDTKFFLKAVDAQISFEKNPEGKVSRLILHQNGRNTPGKRIE